MTPHSSPEQAALLTSLQSLVGEAAVVAWDALAAADRSRFQRAIDPNVPPVCLVTPPSVEALQAVVRAAHQHHWPILITGSGSKIGWGQPVPGAKILLSTAQLTRWVDHAVGDLTLTVEAGVPLATVQAKLAEVGQFLAIDPLYAGTVGGLVATGAAGSLRQRYGGVRDMVLGVEFVRSDGEKAKAGGRVVKNVAGYDLMKLLTGSQGSLAILTQVTLRLYPQPEQYQTQLLWGEGATVTALAQKILGSTFSPVAIDLLSRSVLTALGWDTQAGDLGLCLRFGTLPAINTEQITEVAQLGASQGLQSQAWGPASDPMTEADLWRRIRHLMHPNGHPNGHPNPQSGAQNSPPETVLLKVGVQSTQVGAALHQLAQDWPDTTIAQFQAGSGVGYVRGPAAGVTPERLAQFRQFCQQHQGFVTVLEGPRSMKAAVDVWGYGGNALGLMQAIKQQFDPTGLLNPGRSVGG